MSCGCGCDGDRVHLTANLAGGSRRGTFRGREHLILPVVMLRQTVVNGAFVSKDELKPEAWNGVPVTINHPEERGQTITANSPTVLEQWQVGTIFNAGIKGDRLIAEAWIDIELAEQLSPGLVDLLEGGSPMDVSTGYFPTVKSQAGNYSGKPYTEVHTELKPDHLALLPEATGACSWADGCGVRVNQKGTAMPKPNNEDNPNGLLALLLGLVGNRRGEKNDRKQIIADLISNDGTPFVPEDMYSLMELSQDSLQDLRDKYMPEKEAKTKPKTNATEEGGTTVSDPKKQDAAATQALATNKVSDMSVEDFTALVTNTAKAAAEAAVTEALTANARKELTEKLVANKDLGLTAEELKEMPLSALEKLAANSEKKLAVQSVTKANFGGRPLRTQADDGQGKTATYVGMVSNGASAETETKKKEA